MVIDVRDFKEGTLKLITATDADFAGCKNTRKSSICHAHVLVGKHGTRATLDWVMKAQSGVFGSVGEVELTGLFHGAKANFVHNMLLSRLLRQDIESDIISDSETSLWAVQAGFTKAMGTVCKTQGVKLAWMHEYMCDKMSKVRTEKNWSDIGTKPLRADLFEKHRRFLGQCSWADLQSTCECMCKSEFGFDRAMCNNFVDPAKDDQTRCDACVRGDCTCDCWYGIADGKDGSTYEKTFKPQANLTWLTQWEFAETQMRTPMMVLCGETTADTIQKAWRLVDSLQIRERKAWEQHQELVAALEAAEERLQEVENVTDRNCQVVEVLMLRQESFPLESVGDVVDFVGVLKQYGVSFDKQCDYIVHTLQGRVSKTFMLTNLRALRQGRRSEIEIQAANLALEAFNMVWQNMILLEQTLLNDDE